MIIGAKDVCKLLGIVIISACAVFVSTLFLNYNLDLNGIEAQIADESRALYDALVMTGSVVSAVSGGCLLMTSVVMLCFYIKHYIDSHRKELGILKAMGYSNIRIAAGFWVFGLSVFAGTLAGFSGAYLIMPAFYSVQNESGLLPDFSAEFHPRLLILLVIAPTAAFALLSVIYSFFRMKTPVLDLLKGKPDSKSRDVAAKDNMPFLKELKKITLRGRRSLVFFIAFASFCYSAMVQMSFGMGDLASEMMSAMTFMIGVVLAFTTLFIAVTTVVRSNAGSVSIMKIFGYSGRECSSAILSGYRPAAAAGFVIGTLYQYLLLKIAVEVIFKDIENVPVFEFNVQALIIAAVSFAVVYEAVMLCYSRRIGKISVKEIMMEAE
ncbi:MAG: ABC transporter permease [Oscillospiraceae bacterium]|nr:ABC transporter permease [Oscillospiraceae bacterium]